MESDSRRESNKWALSLFCPNLFYVQKETLSSMKDHFKKYLSFMALPIFVILLIIFLLPNIISPRSYLFKIILSILLLVLILSPVLIKKVLIKKTENQDKK